MIDIELEVHAALNQAFVDADFVLLDIYRPTESSDGAGGRLPDVAPALVASGPHRLIPSQPSAGQQTFNGQVEDVDFVIMSPVAFDFLKGDWFEFGGETYVVMVVPDHPSYESKAGVKRRKP